LRFFDKGAKAEEKLAASHDAMVAKLAAKGSTVAKEMASTWKNEAAAAQASYTTVAPSSNGADQRSYLANLAFEEPGVMERSAGRGRRSRQPDAAPVIDTRTQRPVYKPERILDIRGIFGANKLYADGTRDAARWPNETRPYVPRPGGGCTCGSPGCTG
jgi:hypothetical protein